MRFTKTTSLLVSAIIISLAHAAALPANNQHLPQPGTNNHNKPAPFDPTIDDRNHGNFEDRNGDHDDDVDNDNDLDADRLDEVPDCDDADDLLEGECTSVLHTSPGAPPHPPRNNMKLIRRDVESDGDGDGDDDDDDDDDDDTPAERGREKEEDRVEDLRDAEEDRLEREREREQKGRPHDDDNDDDDDDDDDTPEELTREREEDRLEKLRDEEEDRREREHTGRPTAAKEKRA